MLLNSSQLFVLFFQSIGIFMSVFFFVQYIIIRRKEHLFYALYLTSLWIYCFMAMPEFFFNLTEEDLQQFDPYDLFKRPVQYITSILYTFFVIYYLGLEKTNSKLIRIFRFLIIMYVCLSLTTLLLNYFRVPYNTYYFIISMMMFPVQAYVLIELFKGRIPYSRFIIWGSLLTIAGSLGSLSLTIYGAGNDQISPEQNALIFLPAQICILIDMFLYSIALQKKIADNEKSLINAAFQRQQAILLERERIIADLHDDVGGGLSSIRMMSDLMANQGNPEQSQTGFAERISLTATDIAQRMHTIIWSLNQENDSLDNFIEYVRQYGMNYFNGSPVTFYFEEEVDCNRKQELSGAIRKNMFLIVKEALHNILKHSGATEARIRVECGQNKISIVITDNGKGFPADIPEKQNGYGNGLRNMQKRAEEVGGQISFTTGPGAEIRLNIVLN